MPPASQIALPDRYEVGQHIANGGMASVWAAQDLLLGRRVAVKLLAPHYAVDESARARFQREARTAARVSDHPNVVTVYDIGEHADRAFIVMEHFAGGSVADRLRSGEPIARDEALRWLRDTAAALDHAHAAGIVHRDVKPGNLLLDLHGRVAVGDFGIARLADDTSMTQTGQVLGTAAYLSPEQAMGHAATGASDRYALAVVAHELLTGTRPFGGDHVAAQARAHLESEPPAATHAAPDLPPGVDAVLARGMAKDPEARPQSARELVDGLEAAIGGAQDATQPQTAPTRRARPIVASPPPRRRDPAPPPRRRTAAPAPVAAGEDEDRDGGSRRAWVPLAAAAVVALLVGALVALGAAGGGDEGSTAAQDTAGQQETAAEEPAAEEQPAEPEPEPAPERDPAPADGRSPAELDRAGFDLIGQERYEEAVPLLEAAVQGFRDAGDTGSAGYAFALFNLGTAYNRSGNPAAAIPLFDERLSFSDDRREQVKDERDDAKQRLKDAEDDD